jgi:hypothetical protein
MPRPLEALTAPHSRAPRIASEQGYRKKMDGNPHPQSPERCKWRALNNFGAVQHDKTPSVRVSNHRRLSCENHALFIQRAQSENGDRRSAYRVTAAYRLTATIR